LEWDKPYLVEYKFVYGAKRRAGVARLGIPYRRKEDRVWLCAFQVKGARDDRIRLAHGEDGLQALWIANAFVRKTLDRLKPIGRSGEAHEFVFPRIVTTNYGLEFHARLCEFIDAEVRKKERQIRREWAKRNKSSK
jgi:hypothetical protein